MKRFYIFLIVISAAVVFCCAIFAQQSVKDRNKLLEAYLERDKVVRSYEDHHTPEMGVYYKIQSYVGDSERKKNTSSFLIVTSVEFKKGKMSETYHPREIEVPRVNIDPVTGVCGYLLNQYIIFDYENGKQVMTFLRDEDCVTQHYLSQK